MHGACGGVAGMRFLLVDPQHRDDPGDLKHSQRDQGQGKLPVASLMTPSSHTAPEVPMCDKVLMPAMPAAAVAGESVPVATPRTVP